MIFTLKLLALIGAILFIVFMLLYAHTKWMS